MTEFELQVGKKIKAVKSNCGVSRAFCPFLRECGIVLQYTMPNKPSMNGVTERQNWTFKDMVRNMISHSFSLESLWGEALKPTFYILNRMPIMPNALSVISFTISHQDPIF
ncbi:hypothetical protein CR513_33691, partial [Mucuna pruriens]